MSDQDWKKRKVDLINELVAHRKMLRKMSRRISALQLINQNLQDRLREFVIDAK
jgi:secreted Zn-dependent insulinase-like peptidase